MTARIAAAFRWLVKWFEDGDLVPLLVIVSAAHYIAILSAVDPWFVAVPMGILVDLGHYRAVNIAARYSGNRWHQYAVRWFVAAGLTVISGAYHFRYYAGDLALTLPVPALIVALAYFRQMATTSRAPHKAADAPPLEKAERNDSDTAPHPQTMPRIVAAAHSENGHYPRPCPYCGALQDTPGAYSTHTGRWCKMRPVKEPA